MTKRVLEADRAVPTDPAWVSGHPLDVPAELRDVRSNRFEAVLVTSQITPSPSIARSARRAREKSDLPKHLVIVGDTGMGEYYALDTSQRDSNSERPVVICASGRSQEGDALEIVAPDFGSFFLRAIEEEFGSA